MSATEQEYKNHIKELEQQVRLLKEQVDFLTRKLYGTKSEKTSTLEIEGQMSLFVWQKNKPPARQVEGVALASSKKPPVII